MPSLFQDDKFLAQLDEVEHHMVVIETKHGIIDAYGVTCGPYMLLFQEDELDDLVRLAKTLKTSMQAAKDSEDAEQARLIAKNLSQKVRSLEQTGRRFEDGEAFQPLFLDDARNDN